MKASSRGHSRGSSRGSSRHGLSKDDCWVVIAAFNEEKRLAGVLEGVRAQGFANVVVCDDGSRDGTQALARLHKATVLRHVVNLGKGAAMKTGADYAVAHGARALIFMDADGQHKPEESPLFLDALDEGNAIAFGYRHRNGTMPVVLRFGNWFISGVIKLLYGMDIKDSQCGYRAMTVGAYTAVRWTSRDYSVESEMIARAGKRGLRYAEFEIATIYHDKYKGTTFLDGFPIVWNLLWWRIAL